MYTRKIPVELVGSDEASPVADIPFHAKSFETCFDLLETRYTGLTPSEVEARQGEHGKNIIAGKKFKTTRQIFLSQFKSLVMLLLLVATALSFMMGNIGSGLAILVALLAISGLNLATQWMGQKALSGINSLDACNCTVRRDSKVVQVLSTELVPGDILVFSSGDVIPVDARLILSHELQVDESLVTGESVLIRKDAHALHIPDEDLTEQTNMVFAGSRVKTGRGEAVVTATGSHSVMGKIAKLAEVTQKRDSSLTQGLNRLGGSLLFLVIGASAVIVGVQLYRGAPMLEVIQFGVILTVAAIPEILPSLATFILSLGLRNLSQQNILVKNFHAMESLGGVTVVCTDKTGTLTENSLIMHKIFLPELGEVDYNPDWREGKSVPTRSVEEFLRISRLNNNTVMDGIRSAFMGDPIDIALYRSSSSVFERGYHCVKEIPFDSTTLKTATIVKTQDGRCLSMIKGAPEAVIAQCQYYMRPDGTRVPLDQYERNEFLLRNQELALENALRVIGFAEKDLLSETDEPYGGATFISWVCLVDPPKAGVIEGIQHCHDIGLRVVMITGDQKATAAVTARQLGIVTPESDIWTRKDLDSGVESIPKSVTVFARTKPEEKLAIVESLQKSGEIVSMVGDGVNDTPALQKSDIAIAMGLHGTDAAKESSDIILLNDRFDGIVQAILESRHLTSNIRLCTQYVLSCNMALVMMSLLLSLLGLMGLEKLTPLPINALQVLWLNIVTVTVPTLSLALKPSNDSQYRHPPANRGNELLHKDERSLVVFWAILMMAAGVGTYLLSHFILKQSIEVSSTLTFAALALAQTFNLLNIHLVYSGKKLNTFIQEILTVPIMWIVIVLAFVLQGLVMFLPPLQSVFGTTFVEPLWLLIPVGFALGTIGLSLFLTDVELD
jgi:Ca2+-transporting ATPase